MKVMRFIGFVKTIPKVNADTLLEQTAIMAYTWYTKDQVAENLYIGGRIAGTDFETLAAEGITHIVRMDSQYNSTEQIITPYGTITRLNIKAEDIPSYPIEDHFDQTYEFIDNAIKNNGQVLVHCSCGISRSVAIVINYIMKKTRTSYKSALKLVRNSRKQAIPNYGFVNKLEQLENDMILNRYFN